MGRSSKYDLYVFYRTHLLDGFHLDAIRLDDGPVCQMSHDSGSLN